MANWTQENGAPKPVTNPSEVSLNSSVTGGHAAAPCLIPSFADAVKLLNARYSCLVLDTHRRHISLPPVHLKKKKTGIQEQLNAELLKYSNSLNGVPVAYDNIKVVGQHGNIFDDQGFIHFNIEASFIIFRPKNGLRLVGVINKMGVSHVGCLVHGCFNASVMKPSVLTSDQWRDSGLCVGQSLEFEVFQLDADAAGVLLIRGRLDRSRVQELVAQFEQKQETAESSTEADATEDPTDSPKPKEKKKKKKKDKNETESSMDECVDNSSLQEASENHQTITEEDCNANGRHKEKKKKKKKDKEQDSSEIVPTSDSSGYISDKTSRKRALEVEDDTETLSAKKKKKKSQ